MEGNRQKLLVFGVTITNYYDKRSDLNASAVYKIKGEMLK